MGKEIIWDNIDWTEGDDFLAFAFGDFISSKAGIIRTSDGDRYNINLVPPMQDKTADIPGGDGQYYFGTTHKPKVFDISFAFDDLTKAQLRTLKQTFAGKEMREFCLSEESDKIYMVKVTSQPNIKALCFFDGDDERYRGEGSVQFTAYWPYGRSKDYVPNTSKKSGSGTNISTTIMLKNDGDIDTHFVFEADESLDIKEITIGTEVIKSEKPITYWDSKTGIVKFKSELISYTGNGLYRIPLTSKGVNAIIKHSAGKNKDITFTYYNWYY